MQPAAPSDPAMRTALIDGYRIAWSAEGCGGPTLVAIPGLPGSARDFRWLAPELAPWSRVVRFDPPGFGSSPRAFVPMDATAKARLLLGLLEELAVPQAVLVGHSYGSVVAAHAAAVRPSAVSHLVLIAPPGITPGYPVGMVRLAGRALQHERGRLWLRQLQRRGYRAAGFPSSLSDAELAITSLDSGAADFAGYRTALEAVRPPTLISWAMDDRQVPPRRSAALHRHAGPGPRVEFSSGGHNIQKSRAVELGAFIRAFVVR